MPVRSSLLTVNRLLERHMFVVIFSGMLLGWCYPGLEALKATVPFLFGYMTFVTALNTSWRGILGVVSLPGPVLRIIALLHVAMPLFSLVLARFTLGISNPFTVGLVLAVIIPIGVTSVIWTGLAKGEGPLALTAVTIDSLFSPFLVPASVWLFLGHTVRFDSTGLMLGLLWMIVLPTLAGVTVHDLSRGSAGPRWAPVNGPLSKLCLILVVAVNVAAAHGILGGTEYAILPVLGLLFLQALAGYLLGYASGKALGYTAERVSAFTFCVGMRNISAGIVIALRYFSPQATVPVVLAMLFQQPLASLFHRRLIRHNPAASKMGGNQSQERKTCNSSN
ncbi:MAG: bile acid:sodium symporter family protein [Bacteroidota bacterium]